MAVLLDTDVSIELLRHNLLIVSLALANNCCLVTGNTRHFKKVQGLQLLNWIA